MTGGASVDVLIVSYNTRDLLRSCLRSALDELGAVTGTEIRISVLDNASTDGSADMVAAEFPEVRLIRETANLGFGAANNRLAATSSAPHVLLMNPDTIVTEDLVTPLLAVLESDRSIAVVGPRLVYPDGEPQRSSELFPTLAFEFAREIHATKLEPLLRPVFDAGGVLRRHRREDLIDDRTEHDAEFLWATCWLLRRDEHLQGIFDERFPVYDEDLDLCRRLRAQGRRVVYVPGVELVHLGGRSSTPDRK
ncbi:MAG TPA: glycosyltransferase family 2 protein, partial [Solirubrobacteraceae bacterium]|nr:glycosyltransferase family 2 protein [Solirubrobacteraceae bacterium]